MSCWPLTTVLVRLVWLRAVCGVAEGATATDDGSRSCVAAVLGDAMQRLCILGGRDGMPRSLGSVLSCMVTRFLGGFRDTQLRCISTPSPRFLSTYSTMALSRDGSTMLMPHCGGFHTIGVICAFSGVLLRTIGEFGHRQMQFSSPSQICVASDDFVFIADCGNSRIQILTPRFEFHEFVGVGNVTNPVGVCADAEVIAVSDCLRCTISVFSRVHGALLHRFGSEGSGDGELSCPRELCFTAGNCRIAVADYQNHRISVFRLDGEFVRTLGVGTLHYPISIACSASGDELVVADAVADAGIGLNRIFVISTSDEVLHRMTLSRLTGFAVHGSTIFLQDFISRRCIVLA